MPVRAIFAALHRDNETQQQGDFSRQSVTLKLEVSCVYGLPGIGRRVAAFLPINGTRGSSRWQEFPGELRASGQESGFSRACGKVKQGWTQADRGGHLRTEAYTGAHGSARIDAGAARRSRYCPDSLDSRPSSASGYASALLDCPGLWREVRADSM